MKLGVKGSEKESYLDSRGQNLLNLIENNRLLSYNENLMNEYQSFMIQENLIPRNINSQDLFQLNEIISISDSEVILLLV